jgi:hypothetical protein
VQVSRSRNSLRRRQLFREYRRKKRIRRGLAIKAARSSPTKLLQIRIIVSTIYWMRKILVPAQVKLRTAEDRRTAVTAGIFLGIVGTSCQALAIVFWTFATALLFPVLMLERLRGCNWLNGIAGAVAYAIPRSHRDEILGDFHEQRTRMTEEGYGSLSIRLVTLFKILLLLWCVLKLRLSDLLPQRNDELRQDD